MLQLNKLTSLCKKKKRVGRGGKRGGTSGKGHKGQKARSGASISATFEGGQMPLVRRLPKRGFNNKRFQTEVKIINLQQLNDSFTEGETVDKQVLFERGMLRGKGKFALKVLGTGTLTKKLTVVADFFSKSAEKAIIDLGGQVQLTAQLTKEM